MTLAEFSIRQHIFANMLTLVVIVMGVVCAWHLRREIFPSISTDYLVVQTLDVTLNAPEDVERLITVPIEDRIRNVEDIKEIRSVSAPNLSTIYLKLPDDVDDVQRVLNEVRQEVDQAKSDLPRTAETPITKELKFPFPVLTVGMTYAPGADRLAMKKIADELEDKFLALPKVASVVIAGLNDRELWVEVDPFRARAYGISTDDIGAAIRAKNLNMPGGKLETASGEFTLRTLEQVDENTWRTLENIVVKRVAGQLVRLRDIATVRNTFEKDTTLGRVNGRPAITFTINKQKTGDTLLIAGRVKALLAELAPRLPPGVELDTFNDTSKFVRTRLNTMITSGIQSLLLVLLILLLLINWRIALLVTMGLIFAFFGTFIYLYFVGSSFNLISLFALILVLGMLVDDSVVVCENVFRYLEMGYPPIKAAITGAHEMLWPVVGAVSTTIVAFLPLLLTTGIMGRFIAIIPQIVAVALLLSLLEALFVLPAHLAAYAKPEVPDTYFTTQIAHAHTGLARLAFRLGKLDWQLRRWVDRRFELVIECYRYLLKVFLRWRWLVMAGVFLLWLSALALPASGLLRFKFFGADYADRFMIDLEAPLYFRLEDTLQAVQALEQDVRSNMPPHEIAALITSIGLRMQDEFAAKLGNNQAQIIVDIDEEHPACRRPTPIMNDLRDIVARHAIFTFARVNKEEGGPPVGKAVTVRIMGDDFRTLLQIAEEYTSYLASIPGIVDINDDFERGKNELHIDVDEGKAALAGLDVATIGTAINTAFQGAEVSIFRWGNDEVTVRVKYADEHTRSAEALQSFRIMNREGQLVALGSVAQIVRAPGLANIYRFDRKRALTVTADVDGKRITSREANQRLRRDFANLSQRYPGYSVSYAGEEEDTNESMRSMAIAGAIAIFLIFTILAGILNSFVQPFIILLAIPLGLIGVCYGFMVFQLPLGFMALMGTIGLAGIVVNDSIVLVTFINERRTAWQRARGIGLIVKANPNRFVSNWARWSSLLHAGPLRLRPIFLCAATTIAGMSTIAFVRSGQEQFIAPMALAIVCGLTFSTANTLLVTPCAYAILDDIYLFFFGPGAPPEHGAEEGWHG